MTQIFRSDGKPLTEQDWQDAREMVYMAAEQLGCGVLEIRNPMTGELEFQLTEAQDAA